MTQRYVNIVVEAPGSKDLAQAQQAAINAAASASAASASSLVATDAAVMAQANATGAFNSQVIATAARNEAVAAQAGAEAARDVVVAATAQTFDDLPALLAYTGPGFGLGAIWTTRAEGFSYEQVASGGDIVVSGINLRVMPGLDGAYNVRAFGAPNDGVADATPAILAGVAKLKSLGGGTLFFPNGTYRTTSEILIDSQCIRFVGTGRRKVYPGLFVPSATGLATIMPVHSGTAAVRFFSMSINVASTFTAEDINFATLETGSRPTCCFGFDHSGNFHRDYTFHRVGIHGFTSAFDSYGTGGPGALSFGVIKITNCAINRNTWIARTLTGQWNSFVFEKNEAGQNGGVSGGGIDIKGQAVSIRQNLLEGMRNAVRVSGVYRGCVVGENYFEANSGDYVVRLESTRGAMSVNNYWQSITAAQPLSLAFDVGTTVIERVVPHTNASLDLRMDRPAINPTVSNGVTAAFIAKPEHVQGQPIFPELGGYQITPVGRHFAFHDSGAASYTTTGTGIIAITKTGLSVPIGNYIAVACAVSYVDPVPLPPRFDLVVNNVPADGTANGVFYESAHIDGGFVGKTILYFGVVRTSALCTLLGIRLYPHGLNPAAGLVSHYSLPAIWDIGATLPTNDGLAAGVQVYVPETHIRRVAAAPVAGTWPVGHRLLARAPAAGSFEGWICTTGGTPGTWKTFGAITP